MAVSHGFNLTEATTSVSAPVQVSYTDADDSLHQRKYSPGGSQGNNLGSGGHCCIQAAN